MATITLKRTGQKMPSVGFGLWKVDKETCADTVYNAIKAGYRLFDAAADYGNEKQAGEGLRRALQEGIVKREDIFITSKLWNTFHAQEHVKKVTRMQLEHWGIDYFDLFLIHFPISLKYVDPNHRYPAEWMGDDGKVHLEKVPMHETWKAMEELVDDGLVKNIGLSNCQGSLILDVLQYAKYEPQVLQIELHPYLTQEPLVDLCKRWGIAVTAYSSFGPQSYLELGMGKTAPSLLDHSIIGAIASAHGKTPAQVLLRWATQRGLAVIPKSNDHGRLVSNLQCDGFDLTEQELAAISGLNMNYRLNDPVNIEPLLSIFA
ncbi:NADP-dependent oxidoreductase domain-containing protein [Pisolithus tinctorius]|nr:NADP-dependent oxidoreductase domain-containing protein [Pisolithus tinctorius]